TYRGFKVSVYVSGNSRFAGTSSLFNFQSEIHLRAADGGTCYIAQIGESNVGITQSIDYQLRHLEDRMEQARAGLEMLRMRLATVRSEVDKPWAYAAEYRRLRKEYESMGVALQSEGIEVELSTTFTTEEGESETDNTEDKHGAESAGTNTAEAASTDELGSRRNMFTGLEDWPIIVEEQRDGSDNDAEFGAEVHGNSFGTLSFDFAAVDAGDVVKEEEVDIFLAPSIRETESLSPSDVEIMDTSERAGGEACLWREPDAVHNTKSPPVKGGIPKRRHSSGSKAAQSLPSSVQEKFLWG
ncbi:MAG: hypothetical protein ACJ741_13160, partial [Pyrinomonadaceae bacterium]